MCVYKYIYECTFMTPLMKKGTMNLKKSIDKYRMRYWREEREKKNDVIIILKSKSKKYCKSKSKKYCKSKKPTFIPCIGKSLFLQTHCVICGMMLPLITLCS